MLAISLAIALLAPPSEARISSRIIDEVKQAIRSGQKGQRGRALAWLKGILMVDGVQLVCSDGENRAAATMAIAIWKGALPDSPFRLTRARSRITIRNLKGRPTPVQGHVDVARQLRYSPTSGEMTVTGEIGVQPRLGDRTIRLDERTQVIAHELGHLLGLADTSTTQGLMGPFREGRLVEKPSAEEVLAVMRFRRIAWRALLALEQAPPQASATTTRTLPPSR